MRGDVTKLPKWAQQEIGRLTRDVEYFKAQVTAGPEDSNTFAHPYGEKRPLGDSPTIQFTLADGLRVRCRVEGNVLDINADDSALIGPRSSNALTVRRMPR